jgi:hypothetical protein
MPFHAVTLKRLGTDLDQQVLSGPRKDLAKGTGE